LNTLFDNLPCELKQRLENLKSTLGRKKPGMRGDHITACLENWLLDDEQQQILTLNPWNIFFLFSAAHLFEIGITKSTGNRQTQVSGPATDNIETSSHHLIKIHWKELCIADEDQARIIALICSNIMKDTTDFDLSDNSEKVVYESSSINIALLSSAIRLAAELDLEHPNTARTIAGDLNACSKISTELFCDSFSVSSTGPHAFLPGTIQVKIRCKNFEVHQTLKHHENRMQRLLHKINSQVSPRFLFSEVIYEIEPSGYIPLDMKFTVDSTAALQLFTGNRLYSDRRVFLRELIQNSVDACNLKTLYDKEYTPDISIEFDKQIGFIKFRDNGIGMDRQWIEKYFLKIGISFYQSGDVKNINQNHLDFNFISKFGIGFLSSFLVSEKIVIKTRKKDSPGLMITITNLQDYFDVRFAPKDDFTGTEVTLYFKEMKNIYARGMAYICYLKTNIRYLSIPVELLDHEGKTITIGNEKLAYDKNYTPDCIFLARLDFIGSEAYLFLKAKRNLNTLYALDSAKGGISIFQDGIFVTQTADLLPEGARQNVIGRINLSGKDRCELSMDRNRIFWTEQQLQNIKRKIRLGMVDLANQILEDTRMMNPALTIESSLITHLSIFFDFNKIDDEMYYLLAKPVRKIVAKRFRDFIRINFAHTGKQNNVPEADDYGEKWQREILASFTKRSRPPLPIK
jgi:hypothetical protein